MCRWVAVSPQGQWYRRERAWLLALAASVGISLVFFALLWSQLLGPTGTTILDDYVCAVGPAGVAVLCFRASRRASGRASAKNSSVSLSIETRSIASYSG